MKKTLLFIGACLFFVNGKAQDNFAKGRIVYEQIAGKKIEYVEMWFNSSLYMYLRRYKPDDNLNELDKKKYESLEDSIKEQKKIEIRKMMLDDQPVQKWYGTLADSVVKTLVFIDNHYCVTDTLRFVNWEIKEDTLNIDGIFCQKAIGTTPYKGEKILAWFASSIPISVAPFTLKGLPGLLIQATNESGTMSMKMLELEWPFNKSISIVVPESLPVITKTEYQEVINKHNAEGMKLVEYYKKQLEEKNKKK